MSAPASPGETIEGFAEIMAMLADSFANRTAVLQRAGFDAGAFRRHEHDWTERLARDATGALALAFGEAFARARSAGSAVACDPHPDDDRRFLSVAQPWRVEAAAVPLEASGEAPPLLRPVVEATWPSAGCAPAPLDLDATAELAFDPARSALPFTPTSGTAESSIRRMPAPCRIHEPPIRPHAHELSAADSTMELRLSAPVVPVLPFTAPRVPRGRLHRFDTQTGQPLAMPLWIDDVNASDPTKPA
ncbi:MAG: hypothetical protein ABJE95_21555 [Byssovorax sp.]